LLGTFFVPRFLGDHDLGQYAVATTVTLLVGTIAGLGVPNFLTRHVARYPEEAQENASVGMVVTVGLAALLSAALSVVLTIAGLGLAAPYVLPLALATTIPVAGLYVVSAVLVGQERYARGAWLSALPVAIGTLLGIVVLLLGGGLLGFMVTSLIVYVIAMVLAWRSSGFKFRRAGFNPRAWRAVIAGGAPFLGWNVAARIRSESDRIVLIVLSSAAAVGWYAAALRIIAIPMFIPTLITTPLLPALSRVTDEPVEFGKTMRRTLITALLLTLPLSALIIALAPVIPGIFHWGSSFVASVPLMMILAVQQPILVTNILLSTCLIALNRERRWLVVGVVGALFNPLANLLAIPAAQSLTGNAAIGAAVVVGATEILMLSGALILLPRGLLTKDLTRSVVTELVAAGALLVVVAAVRDASVPFSVALGLLAYCALAVVLGAVQAADFRAYASLARALLPRGRPIKLEA
jgi:O-antigen/teichoic acid export membrane protein